MFSLSLSLCMLTMISITGARPLHAPDTVLTTLHFCCNSWMSQISLSVTLRYLVKACRDKQSSLLAPLVVRKKIKCCEYSIPLYLFDQLSFGGLSIGIKSWHLEGKIVGATFFKVISPKSWQSCHYAHCHCTESRPAECHYAECRYAECHGAAAFSTLSPHWKGTREGISKKLFMKELYASICKLVRN